MGELKLSLPNYTVIEHHYLRRPSWAEQRDNASEAMVPAVDVYVKVDGHWMPPGIETYSFDSDEQMIEHCPKYRIVALPLP